MNLLHDTFLTLFPLYVYMALGLLLRKVNLLNRELTVKMNAIVFKVFIPCSLFISAYNADLSNTENINGAFYAIIANIILFVILILVIPKMVKNGPKAASVSQCIFRSNYVLIGLAYVELLYGSENLGQVSIMIAMIVPVYNALAVLNFELLRGGKVNIRNLVKNIVTNPLIIATVIGILIKLSGITIPSFVLKPISSISSFASPFAMILVGSMLTFSGFKNNGRLIAIGTIGRLIMVPAVFLTVAVLLGFKGIVLVSLMTAFAGPTAVAGTPMAFQLGGDGELAGELVASTTIFSTFTLYFIIVLLRAVGLI